MLGVGEPDVSDNPFNSRLKIREIQVNFVYLCGFSKHACHL